MGTMKDSKRKSGRTPFIILTVNDRRYELEVGQGEDTLQVSDTLAYTLRETLGLTGTKIMRQWRMRVLHRAHKWKGQGLLYDSHG